MVVLQMTAGMGAFTLFVLPFCTALPGLPGRAAAAIRQAPLVAAVSFACGVAAGCAISSNPFEVYATAADIPNNIIREHKALEGVVVTVTDGDTLRVRHTPLFLSGEFTGKLSEETIQVRLLAVDAPEVAKFGSDSQPYAEAAKQFVSDAVLHKRVKVNCIGRDRYGRLIGELRYGFFGNQELSSSLLRRGLAVVYRGTDGSYGHRTRAEWELIEAEAKRQRQGMWSEFPEGVSPSEYKRQQRSQTSRK
jgi:micrococcal nuclease